MAIDYDKLMTREFPQVEQAYTHQDTILYALGVGLGADPVDPGQLRFVYEPDLAALPSMAAVLAGPGFWVREPETGVDWVRVLHGEQDMEFHRPLPPEGTITAQTRIAGIVDKGADKGAIIHTEREGVLQETGETLFTVRQTTFARGDGGFHAGGGSPDPGFTPPPPQPVPDTPPDLTCDLTIAPQAALIYRLSGDPNPLHADPKVAAQAGYPRPILHGLCTLGVAGHAVLKTCCGYDPARCKSLKVRFTAPVYPGETLRTEMWRVEGGVAFRSLVVERDVVALNHGYAAVDAAG